MGVSGAGLAGIVTVGPVPTSRATAVSSLFGSGRLISTSFSVTVAAAPPSPKMRVRNLVITPLTGAPPEYGSPFGFEGWMKAPIVQGVRRPVHSPELAGSLRRRLPKVVAASAAAGAARRTAMVSSVARGASSHWPSLFPVWAAVKDRPGGWAHTHGGL